MPAPEPTMTPASARQPDAGHGWREAFARLEGWLRDPRGRPVNDLAEGVLAATDRVLLRGWNGWSGHAEERLEALLVCPDLVGVPAGQEREFCSDVDDVLDAMYERVAERVR